MSQFLNTEDAIESTFVNCVTPLGQLINLCCSLTCLQFTTTLTASASKSFSQMRRTVHSPAPSKTDSPVDQLSRELSMLQKQRNMAISECEFAKARAIDCHIDRLKEEIAHTQRNSKRIQNELVYDMKKEEVRMKAAQILQETRDRIFAKQALHQQRLMELHRLHSEELVDFANQFTDALQLETTRIIPDAVYLRRQAQFNAKNRNYAAAEMLIEESNQTRIEKTARNQDEIQNVFEGRKLRILKRHDNDNAMCIEKQEKEIELIEKEFEKKIDELKNSLSKTAADLEMKLVPEDFAFLNEFMLKEEQKVPVTPKRTPRKDSASVSSTRKRTPVTPRSTARSPRMTPR